MVLKKCKNDANVLFIDASQQFVKETNNNKLSDENIETILSAFGKREVSEYFSKLVSNEEIAAQGYNLSVSTYVEKEDAKEEIDIEKLNEEIKEIVAREDALRKEIDKIIGEIEVQS